MNKKYFFSVVIALATPIIIFAQANVSNAIDIRMEKEVIPPDLTFVGEPYFEDGCTVIKANETHYITCKVKNTGKGVAEDCVAKITAKGATDGLTYNSQDLPSLKPGESKDVRLPITSSMYTVTGRVTFTVQIDEPNNYGTVPAELPIETMKLETPKVVVLDPRVILYNEKLIKRNPFKLQILVQNLGDGIAKDVEADIVLPDMMHFQVGRSYNYIGQLNPGEQKKIEVELNTNVDISDVVSINIDVKESYGKYASPKKITLEFGKDSREAIMVPIPKNEPKEKPSIKKGSLFSDVDVNIPNIRKENSNTYALIIANENYETVASVPFAKNDGDVFKSYCEKTLGVPSRNILYLTNATGNNLKSEISTLVNLIHYSKDPPHVIVYYAGHGIPDSHKNGNAYLLPVDGVASDYSTGYKLDDLYAALDQYPSESVTVFLDACFSGGTRNGNETLDPETRGVAIKVKKGQPVGNMIVFAAAQDDQTAIPDSEQQHGMFTYYILKKLQETSGDITMDELTSYVIQNVSLESSRVKHKQVPCVTASPSIGDDWKGWKLR